MPTLEKPNLSHVQHAMQLSDSLRENGYVFFREILPVEQVDQAREEILALYDQDLEERSRLGVTEAHYTSAMGRKTILTAPSHLMLDIYGKSPTFDALFESLLTHPVFSSVLESLAGKNIKLRGYNIRRMTGEYDPGDRLNDPSSIPHEWHRDSLGEFCIGVLLTDIPGPDHGATALLPKSHLFPYCPRWNCLFSDIRYTGSQVLSRLNIWNRRLGEKLFKDATGGHGKRGDVYIFINDIWHGRQPNLHGHETMILMAGGFPTEIPYPDEVPVPPVEITDRLPPNLANFVRQSLPLNPYNPDTIFNWMQRRRQSEKFLDPFYLARMERKVLEKVSKPLMRSKLGCKVLDSIERLTRKTC